MSFGYHLWALFFHIYFFWLPPSLLNKVPFAMSKDIRLWSSLSRSCMSAVQKKPASLVQCSSCWNFWCVLKNSAAYICWLACFSVSLPCHFKCLPWPAQPKWGVSSDFFPAGQLRVVSRFIFPRLGDWGFDTRAEIFLHPCSVQLVRHLLMKEVNKAHVRFLIKWFFIEN